MKLLVTPSQLEKTFSRLLDQYQHVSFAVAWASYDFLGYDQLLKQRGKITRAIIGTHFYRTHPVFIENFMNHKRVKFIKQPVGTFHPKFYLFYNSPDDWACLLGSANFTSAAFKTNSEACLHFEAADDGGSSIRGLLEGTMKTYWKMGKRFKSWQLTPYRRRWAAVRRRMKLLTGKFGDKGIGKPIPKTSVLWMSWSEYLKNVVRDKPANIDERIGVLRAAHHLFQKRGHFDRMSPEERKDIAGFGRQDTVKWWWFGKMFGNGTFMGRVNDYDPHLSRALDAIPLKGEIRREDYIAYIEEYRKAFRGGRRHGFATATRLLAMKRPDYFVCYDSKNKRKLCQDFSISLYRKNYEKYWDLVIAPMLDTEWWNARRPKQARALNVWLGRAAFLDSIYYEP